MEELYAENFSKQYQHERAGDLDQNFHRETLRVQEPENNFDLSISQKNDQNISQKNSLLLDMSIFLSRLENEIERQYADFADYRFIFNKIRTAFKQNSVEGVND